MLFVAGEQTQTLNDCNTEELVCAAHGCLEYYGTYEQGYRLSDEQKAEIRQAQEVLTKHTNDADFYQDLYDVANA